MNPREKAARIAEHLSEHDEHGYSQIRRDGDGWEELVDIGDGKPVRLHRDYDCSRMAIDCYKEQGVDTGGASYTMDMYLLMDGDFCSVPVENRQRGDILNSTRARHAAIYLGRNLLAEAWKSETGGIDGDPGDQTGWEIRIRPYYDDEWTACYRCTKQEFDGWVQTGNDWYFYRDGEPVCNEWRTESEGKYAGCTYYLGTDGRMAKGWQKIGSDWYCFGTSTGRLWKNRPVEYGGKWCWLGPDGKCVRNGTVTVKDWYMC